MSITLEPPPREQSSQAMREQWMEKLWRKLNEAADIVSAGGAIGDHKLWFSETLPTVGTWAWCDGTSYLRATYPDWFAIHGSNFGAADSTHFNVLDARGRFMRMWDNAASNDPDHATRTANASGGQTGNHIGTLQGEQFKAHFHNIDDNAAAGNPLSNYAGGPYAIPANSGFGGSTVDWSSGGTETRPVNFYAALITRLA